MTTAKLECKTAGLETKTAALEARVRAMAAEIAELKVRQERAEIDAAVRRSDEQFARGEGIPVRQAMETIRRKYNIPLR
jgi:hypothetical protein